MTKGFAFVEFETKVEAEKAIEVCFITMQSFKKLYWYIVLF